MKLIEVPQHEISSLKGIEYFTNLETLDCGGNDLTTLDVRKNTALTGLDCGYNRLTALDVSKNTALEYLSYGGNRITNLDVSGHRNLQMLYYYNDYDYAISVYGSKKYLTWKIIDGLLPAGFYLDDYGEIHGKPIIAGSHHVAR